MNSEIANIHDAFFKETFTHIEPARSFLEHYIPKEVTAFLDLSTLTICKDSFIDSSMQTHFSDILYEVKLSNPNRKHHLMLAYILYEHKSEAEQLTAYQVLVYMVNIWEARRKQQCKPFLVPIIPIVIYHGKKAWDAPTLFRELFRDVQDELMRYLPNFEYNLFDLSTYTDEDINGDIRLRLYFSTLEYIHHQRKLENMVQVFDFLAEMLHQQTGKGYMDTVMRYLAQIEGVKEEILRTAFEKSLLKKEVNMTTLAQIWTERGKKEGEKEGRKEGLLDGLETALDIKFGMDGISLMPELRTIKSLEVLQLLRSAIRTANSAQELRSIYAQNTANN